MDDQSWSNNQSSDFEREKQRRRETYAKAEQELLNTERELTNRRRTHRRTQRESSTHRSGHTETTDHRQNRTQSRSSPRVVDDYDTDIQDIQRQIDAANSSLSRPHDLTLTNQNFMTSESFQIPTMNTSQGKPILHYSPKQPLQEQKENIQVSQPFFEMSLPTSDNQISRGAQFANRKNHQELWQEQLSQVESKFYENFQKEKQAIIDQSYRDAKQAQENLKRKYEAKIAELEAKVESLSTVSWDLEEVRKELQASKERENALQIEKKKLITEFEWEKKQLEDKVLDLQIVCGEKDVNPEVANGKNLVEKVKELEARNSYLKKQLEEQRLLSQKDLAFAKDEMQWLINQLEKFKGENVALKEKLTLGEVSQSFSKTSFRPQGEHSRENSSAASTSLRINAKSPKASLDGEYLKYTASSYYKPTGLASPLNEEDEIKSLREIIVVLKQEKDELLKQNKALKNKLSAGGLNKDAAALPNEWKEKCLQLTEKYYNYLAALRKENEKIREDVQIEFEGLKILAQNKVESLLSLYKKKIESLEAKLEYYQTKYGEALCELQERSRLNTGISDQPTIQTKETPRVNVSKTKSKKKTVKKP